MVGIMTTSKKKQMSKVMLLTLWSNLSGLNKITNIILRVYSPFKGK